MHVIQAVARGAVLIVAEEKLEDITIPQLTVPNVREFMSLAAKRFHDNVCDKMDIIAVVGTNGKTTCAHMLKHILGKNTGVIGTLGASISYSSFVIRHSSLTTPDPIELHEIFAQMYARGVRTVVMEVTAHAIHYHKVAGITFRAGIFTNITQDHLDFFENMEKYAETKVGFMTSEAIQTAIVNFDDPYGQQIAVNRRENGEKAVLYSISALPKILQTTAPRFNVYNELACIYTALELRLKPRVIRKALKTMPQVPGRFNVYKTKNKVTAIIDYAHTPDALEKLLTAARELVKDEGRLVAVFGCGGNRDKSKREIMGSVAAKLSDYIVVTSDNPRDEPPMVIMLQIKAGIETHPVAATPRHPSILKGSCSVGFYAENYCLIENREEAVRYALDNAKAGDVVVIAGKGAETTQEIAGRFIPYNDSNIVKQYIK